ncbi:30S ribosomal protein S7 [Symbiobacterium thermophilum]|jgi:small subunit ribosomal protein S7|uniref:Small ribosomal subunit protein uS7 n=2 Tax=Symbiobacterium thermophilum TaxID=2734 RepID=RS7_SYMTH|nr:30S ribosomal protein S7 [Symbiobacterium thermophilum]Q67JT9.1 RecName: Full=Small ribosomal subunit protein uS7; AltName: Full=30S ribosomal protein S7 [Symbiobacterium thermophilum IAM 14863]MBY6274750.1 30S ribosomal protein S7 [Symbiobacterium thermophilum]BAD42061.1 30S ribosomal protein S7 [Symbiobacterium thermophilum IAM 14863]
MPRRGHVPKREVQPDPVYNSELVTRVINKIMLDGKKALAQRIFYEAIDKASAKLGKEPMEVLEGALKNIMPVVETRSRRVGGATYQVPMEVRPERRQALGIRWLVQFARARGERTMVERLAAELVDAFNNTGGAVKKKEEVHRMAEANKPFAHYRW